MADDDVNDDVPQVEEKEFNIDGSDDLDQEFEADESIEALAESESDDGDDDDDVKSPKRTTKAKAEDEEEEDEDEDEDDDEVEADLGEILKDRIAAGDDEDEEDEDELIKQVKPVGDFAPKRDDEWTCEQCFFIVSKNQFGPRSNPRCPQGEGPCASIERALS